MPLTSVSIKSGKYIMLKRTLKFFFDKCKKVRGPVSLAESWLVMISFPVEIVFSTFHYPLILGSKKL